MSTTIDQKVVSMKFDNSHFESNVKTTLSTLDKLKQSLNLKGASQGLENVSATAKKCDMSELSNGIETVQTKFSALQVIGVTALANITNSAVNAATNIVKMFTIDPITTGFQEYELKMNSVQTIMASTGASLSEVNGYLEELNLYADKTIYSFSDMTTNIGKFTNAGVSLDKAVLAIKGVSNEAAVSGANANEASRAMYNFAQALSAGYVKLIDWKSIENANMATVEFKNQLIETAVSCGTLTDNLDGTYSTLEGTVISATQNFNESLQDQWMTTDVLVDTLSKYADETTDIGKKAYASAQDVKTFSMMMDTLKESAQSGWAQTWEIIVGDFEEAKSMWTYLTNIFGGIIDTMSSVRNNFLEGVLGGGGTDAWGELASQVEDAGISIDDFKTKLIEVGKEHGVITDEMINEAGSFEKSLTSGWASVDIVSEALGSFSDSAGEFVESTEDMTDKLEYFQDIVDRVWYGEFYNGAERIDALTEAGYDYAEVQELVNKTVDGHRLTLEDLGEEQARSIGFTEEQISALKDLQDQAKETGTPINELINSMSKKSGRTLLLESFKNILEQIGKVVNAVKKAWDEVFGNIEVAEIIYKIIESFSEWASSIEITDQTLQNITATIKGFLDAVWLLGAFASGPISFLNKMLKVAGNLLGTDLNILTVTGYIGKLISSFKAWITKDNELMSSLGATGKKIKQFVADTSVSIAQWVRDFIALPAVQEKIEAIKNAFINTGDSLKEWFNGLVELFRGFIENVKSMDGLTLDGLKEQLKSFGSSILEHFGKLGEVFSKVTGAISGFKDQALSNLGPAKQIFEGFYQTIYKFFTFIKSALRENIGFAEILTTLAGAAIIVGAVKLFTILTKLTNAVSDFLGSWAKVGKAVAGAFDSLGGMFKSFGKAKELEAKAALIRSLALAIGVLAASIWLIAQIPAEDLKRSCIVMAGAIAVLVGVAFALGKIKPLELDIIAGARVIAALAASLLLLAISLKIMNDLDIGKMVVSVILLGVLMAALAATAVLMSKYAPKLENGQAALAKGSLALLGIAASLLILSVALKIMNDMDMKNASISVGLLIVLMGSMALLSKACEKLKFSPKVGVTMLAFSASLLIIIFAIKLLAGIETGDIVKAGLVVAGLFILFGAISALTKFAGPNAAKAGLAILGMSAALLLTVASIKLLAGVEESEMKKAAKVVAGLMIVFGAVVALSNFAGKYAARAGIMLIGMASAMLILTAALVILSHIDEAGLKRGVIAIECLGSMFAALIFVTKYANISADTFKALIGMTIAIGAIAIALGVLAMIDPKRLASSVLSLSITMAAFGLLIKSVGSLGSISTKAIISLGVMVVAIGLIAAILYQLGALPVESNMGNAASLSVLMLSFAGSLKIISTISGISKKAYIGMAAMLGVVIALAAVLAVMSVLDVKGNIETAVSIGILLLAMAASLKILDSIQKVKMGSIGAMALLALIILEIGIVLHALSQLDISIGVEQATALGILLVAMSVALVPLSLVGKLGTGAFIGIGALAVLIIAVGSLLIALGALKKYWPAAEEFIDFGLPLLEKIGYGIGSFFGNVIGGFIDSAYLDRISAFGTKLSEFMENIQPFLDSAKNISEDSVSGIKKLAEAIALICAADLMNSITSFITGGNTLSKFASEISIFGDAMIDFSKKVKGKIDQDAVESAANAGKMMAALQESVPKTGGVVGFFTGTNNLGNFGMQLSLFAKGIVSFAKTLKEKGNEIDQSTVEAAASAGKVMAALQETVPKTGGVVSFFAGTNNLATFGIQLSYFAKGIVSFAKTLKAEGNEIDQSTVEAAAKAGATMVALQETVPKTGGVVDFFTGTSNLGYFGTQLSSFARGIVSFAKTLKKEGAEIDQSTVEAAAKAGSTMVALQETVPKTGGVVDFFTGTSNLGYFGTQLVLFAKGIVSFAKTLKAEGNEIDQSTVEAAAKAGSMMVALQKTLPETGGVVDFFSGSKNLASFGSQLALFGSGVASFSKSIKENGGIDEGAVQAAVNASRVMLELQNGLPESEGVFEKLNKWFNGGGKDVSTLGDLFAKFGDAIKTFAGKMKEVDTTALATASSSVQTLYGIISSLNQLEYDPEKMSLLNTALVDLGGSLKSFSTNMTDFDTGSLFNASISIQTLYGILNGMTGFSADGVINFKTALDELSTISIDNFVNSFANAGPRLSAAITSMMSALTTSITSQSAVVANAFNTMLTNAASTIQGYTGSFVTAGMSLAIALGQGVSSGTSTVYSAITSVISQCTSFAASQAGTFSSAGISMMSSLAVGLQSGGSMAYAVIFSVLQSCISYISGQVSSFQEGGAQLATSFANGIKANAGNAVSEVENMVESCKTAGDGIKSAFETIGGNAAEGFKVGIRSKAWEAAEEARTMVEEALEAARKAADVNSPSKEFRKIGYAVPEGFAQGIDRLSKLSENSAVSMVRAAIDSAKLAVSKFGEAVSGDLDVQPTITPVVDMSSVNDTNIQLGANINAVLSKPIDSMSQLMSNAQAEINESNQRVVDAVNGLREDLAALYSVDDQEIALYMDSRKVASTLVRPMNQQLNIALKRGGGL